MENEDLSYRPYRYERRKVQSRRIQVVHPNCLPFIKHLQNVIADSTADSQCICNGINIRRPKKIETSWLTVNDNHFKASIKRFGSGIYKRACISCSVLLYTEHNQNVFCICHIAEKCHDAGWTGCRKVDRRQTKFTAPSKTRKTRKTCWEIRSSSPHSSVASYHGV